ncbi:MAG: biopolymer transporter ExbD [Elusimicrobiota bacterium]
MRASEDGDGPITEINVTPLVDIVLVVLIIFMATAPMIARRAIKVSVPSVAKSDKAATDAMAVALDGERRLTLSGKPVSLDDLKKTISTAVALRPDQAVTVSADKKIIYGEVAELLDAIRGAGVKKVGLEVRRK